MRILLYTAIAVLVVYIGAEPLVAKASHVAALVMNYVCDALVIASMFMLLMYYSKYGKVGGYLSRIEDELADAGYYLSDRPEPGDPAADRSGSGRPGSVRLHR